MYENGFISPLFVEHEEEIKKHYKLVIPEYIEQVYRVKEFLNI